MSNTSSSLRGGRAEGEHSWPREQWAGAGGGRSKSAGPREACGLGLGPATCPAPAHLPRSVPVSYGSAPGHPGAQTGGALAWRWLPTPRPARRAGAGEAPVRYLLEQGQRLLEVGQEAQPPPGSGSAFQITAVCECQCVCVHMCGKGTLIREEMGIWLSSPCSSRPS